MRPHTIRSWIIVVGIAIIAAVVGAVYALQDGDESGAPSTGAASGTTPTAAPTAMPSASDGGAPQAAQAPLLGPIDDGFMRRDLAPNEMPETHGITFVHIESGEREFWTVALPGRPGDDYYASYSADPTHRWMQLRQENAGRSEVTLVFADRTTAASYRFDSERWVLVAGPTPEGLLVAQSRSEPASFVLIDLASKPQTISFEFSLPLAPSEYSSIVRAGMYPAREALLLGDGETLLLAVRTESNLEPSKVSPPRLFAVSIRSGEVARLPHVSTRTLLLRGTSEGGARILTLDDEWTSYAVSPTGELSGPRIVNVGRSTVEHGSQHYVSPDGRWLTWQEQVPLQVQGGVGEPWHWPAVYLADLETGEVVLRTLRVDPITWLGDRSSVHAIGGAAEVGAIVWQQWRLHDREAFLLKTPARGRCPDQCVYYVTASPGELAVLRPDDGSLEALPMVPDGAFAAALAGLPPGNLGLSADSRELRIEGEVRPGRDFGGGVSSVPLPPLVQRPPFSDALRLQVSVDGDGLNLRSAPTIEAEILGTLADSAIVTVTDGECPVDALRYDVCSVAFGPDGSGEDAYWLHVQADLGLEGWVSAEYVTWAE